MESFFQNAVAPAEFCGPFLDGAEVETEFFSNEPQAAFVAQVEIAYESLKGFEGFTKDRFELIWKAGPGLGARFGINVVVHKLNG